MNKSKLKERIRKRHGVSMLYNVTSVRTGLIMEYTDSRTITINNTPHVYPIGILSTQVYVCCPYCKQFHLHVKKKGLVSAHCKVKNKIQPQYYIESEE